MIDTNDFKYLDIDTLTRISENLNKILASKIEEEKTKPITLTTESDRASVMIGNSEFQLSIFNHYGDGTNEIYIYKSDLGREKDFGKDEYKACHTVNGHFYIYPYDCQKPSDLDNTYELEGTYYIYVYAPSYTRPKIVFVKY